MMGKYLSMLLVIMQLWRLSFPFSLKPSAKEDLLSKMIEPVTSILRNSVKDKCLLLVITDGSVYSRTLELLMGNLGQNWELGVITMLPVSGQNNTLNGASLYMINARHMRKSSSCTRMIVVSENAKSLERFAEESLKNRLLVWPCRLLVVTRLSQIYIRQLLESQWTFIYMNVMILNLRLDKDWWIDLYTKIPYTAEGAKIIRLASVKQNTSSAWSEIDLFPEKYDNFHRQSVKISVGHYKPLWFETKTTNTKMDGSPMETTGMDYLLLKAVADSLNFTFDVVLVKYFSEALDHMEKRTTFALPVYHAVLYTRLQRFEYTTGYTYSRISFSMAKPGLTANWESLYNPLNDEVWISILVTAFVITAVFIWFQVADVYEDKNDKMTKSWIMQLLLASLLSQSLSGRLPTVHSLRVLFVAWLIFAFIMGSAYRGNLTASLTLPKYPSRPETIPELVQSADSVTMAAWGKDFITYFKKSDSPDFERLADLMEINVDTISGLQQATEKRQAHMETIHKLRLDIAEKFTDASGNSRLYIGRDSVMPGLAAWPIPHDSPYKIQLDRCISAVVEGGLYEKWTDNMMDLARKVSAEKRRELEEQDDVTSEIEEQIPMEEQQDIQALTVSHMQGPLVLILLGLTLGLLVFILEILASK